MLIGTTLKFHGLENTNSKLTIDHTFVIAVFAYFVVVIWTEYVHRALVNICLLIDVSFWLLNCVWVLLYKVIAHFDWFSMCNINSTRLLLFFFSMQRQNVCMIQNKHLDVPQIQNKRIQTHWCMFRMKNKKIKNHLWTSYEYPTRE